MPMMKTTASQTVPAPSLLVVGAGRLGAHVAALWQHRFPGGLVLAETRSSTRHSELRAQGLAVRTIADESPPPVSHLLFSVPPSEISDYRAATLRALSLWNGEGRFLFVSSAAVYAEERGGEVHENSAVVLNARTERLLVAEAAVRDARGMVIRLAGLYDRARGPHRVYFHTAESSLRPDGLINLIHYDDAANLCLAALTLGQPLATYLGSDQAPLTRTALVERTRACGLFEPHELGEPTRFTGQGGPLGKRLDGRWSRQELNQTHLPLPFPERLVSAPEVRSKAPSDRPGGFLGSPLA